MIVRGVVGLCLRRSFDVDQIDVNCEKTGLGEGEVHTPSIIFDYAIGINKRGEGKEQEILSEAKLSVRSSAGPTGTSSKEHMILRSKQTMQGQMEGYSATRLLPEGRASGH